MAKKISIIFLIVSWLGLAVAFFCLEGFTGAAHGGSKQACYDECTRNHQQRVEQCIQQKTQMSDCIGKSINVKEQCISDCLNNKRKGS